MATITQFNGFRSRDNTTAISNTETTSTLQCARCGYLHHGEPGVDYEHASCPNCGAIGRGMTIPVLTALSYMDQLRAAIILADAKQGYPAYDYALAS